MSRQWPFSGAKAPWYSGPEHVLRMLCQFLLLYLLAPGLLILIPIAAVLGAHQFGVVAQFVVGVPIGLFCLANLLAWAVVAFDLADEEDAAGGETSRWATTRTWTRTPDASMGAWLRREREGRGRSLADINTKTAIHAKYLRAIEDDRFDLLPSGLLRRSFLRQYAEQVGLQPTIVLSLFEEYVHGKPAASSGVILPHHAGPIKTVEVVVNAIVVPSRDPLGHCAARTVFGIVEAVLPKRLADEELGDALEYIAAYPSGWRVWIKIASTVFWIGVNAWKELTSAFGRKTG